MRQASRSTFRAPSAALSQGERIYSMGNPLDVGFAVLEGTYNGLVERSFYPSIFFGGALNSGMSGGPALDEQGRVVGVNVADASRRPAGQLPGAGGICAGAGRSGPQRRAHHRGGLPPN